MKTYKIVRFFFKGERETIRENVSLEEAKEHCADPETNSSTCEEEKNLRVLATKGPWFDGFEEE